VRLILPLLALCFAAGTATAGGWPTAARWPWLIAAGLTLGALARSRGPALGYLAALLAAALAGGWAAGSAALSPRLPPCHVSRHTGTGEVRLIATVDDDPVAASGGDRQLLRADGLLPGEGAAGGLPLPLCGGVELRHPAGAAPLHPGERVLLATRLRPAVSSRNPGAPSSRLRYLSEDVGAVAQLDPERVVLLEAPRRATLLAAVRGRVRAAITRAVASEQARVILIALVLGDGAIGPSLRQDYARAGASHLLAVSGLHLTIVALGALAAVRWLLLRCGVGVSVDPRRLAALPAAAAVIGYTLVTGSVPSAVRSCVMACACFIGLLGQRSPDGARPLALAALGLLAWDPLNLFRASCQLSFLAVVGLLLIARRERPRPTGRLRAVARWARDLFLASLAASLLTAPISAHHFHQVSLAGLLVNLVGVPFTSFALLPASLIGSTLGALHPALGAPVLTLSGWLASGLNAICHLAAGWELSALHVSVGWLAAAGCGAGGLALLLRARAARRAALALAVLCLGVAATLALSRRAEGALELTFLDVGQGDSTFLRLPDGTSVLVDGGGGLGFGERSSGGERGGAAYDPGEARVVPFLRGAGVRRLDLVVASHPHPDHVGGLVAVLRELPVRELWVCWHDEPDGRLEALLDEARRRGVVVASPRPLERGRTRLLPLWPAGAEGQCADRGFEANDNSIVLRVEHGRAAALLTGDIEAEVERLLVRRAGARVRADLLKVAHHGSATSSTDLWLEAVSPRLAVISCGPQNHFGFPAPRVLARYRARGVPLARVDQLGAVGVRLHADGRLEWSALAPRVP